MNIEVFVCADCGIVTRVDEDGCCGMCGRECRIESIPITPSLYMEGAVATESGVEYGNHSRILHAAMGLCTEAGELMDQLKKHLFYGKELDDVNLIEEAGDLLWYLAVLFDELGTSFEEVMQINHDKLAKRYGEKFSSEAALHRDLEGERDILEGKGKT